MPLKEGSWLIPPRGKMSWMWKISSRISVATVGLYSKLWIEWMNKINVHNKQALKDVTENRPKGKGLLTVSNHTSCADDPLMWGILKTSQLISPKMMRWTSAAEDICFQKYHFISQVLSWGQVFPLVRGDGVYQNSLDFMIEELDLGTWCHIFPEGKVNMTHDFMRLKWGVGRIIADCTKTPVVLPLWHVGMDTILPNRRPYIPKIKKKVTLLIGNPMDFTEELQALRDSKKTPKEMRKYLTDRIQDEFLFLKQKAEALHKEMLAENDNDTISS